MKQNVFALSPREAKEFMASHNDYLLVDLRPRAEFAEMHLPGAVCIPYSELLKGLKREQPARSTPILLYARSALRSRAAAAELMAAGYRRVYDLGALNDWPYEVID